MIVKTLLCVIGIVLFASNPWRDLWFYESVADHEGFGTIADAYVIGFAFQFMATVLLFPLALFFIIYGIVRATRISLIPRFDRFTFCWGVFSSILAILMLLIEGDHLLYYVQYVHHWDTGAITLIYVAFIYVWWCCSISHGGRDDAVWMEVTVM